MGLYLTSLVLFKQPMIELIGYIVSKCFVVFSLFMYVVFFNSRRLANEIGVEAFS